MRKDTALSFRLPRRLKADLEKVALNEGRSLSQVCEALLAGGLDVYRKEGAKYLQRLLSRQKKEPSEYFSTQAGAISLFGVRNAPGASKQKRAQAIRRRM